MQNPGITLIWQPLQIRVCDIVTSQIRAGPVKMDEQKHAEHGDIEKKLDIFHILNGILAKTRNLILWKKNSLAFLSIDQLNQMLRNTSPARQLITAT